MTAHVSQRIGQQVAPSIEFGTRLVHRRFSIGQSPLGDRVQSSSHVGLAYQFQKGSRHAF